MSNHLINETSPYLLQHAENPVDWYPWGEEALRKAKAENKPILVSIGYSACHWCHVMERESFECASTATLMNKYFVNIKVDREERPDIDHMYMDAVQAITGQGGWPLNVFLTPEGKPFYGGTYFPPKPYANRPSWNDVLLSIHQSFEEKQKDVTLQADNLIAHLQNANALGVSKKEPDLISKQSLLLATQNVLQQADAVWGGFGKAPKFPQTFSIQYLLRDFYFTKNELSKTQALLSLDKMIQGGIYDQIGGGLARYSTDEKWLAPHFEKMLYDNALFISALSDAYQLTQKEQYKDTIAQTVAFLERELMHSEGAFFAALDADSEGVEGKYYTWQKAEIEAVLGDAAEMFCLVYDVETKGNWEDTNILWLPQTIEEIAAPLKINPKQLAALLNDGKQKLLEERNKRIRPGLDDKILLGWNAMLIEALCAVYSALGEVHYLHLAERCFSFLENEMYQTETNTWLRTWKNNTAKIDAFLDDYANVISSCIQLQEATGNTDYLDKAKKYTQKVMADFSDENQTLFYFTAKNQKDILVRKKEIYDGATASGNALMAQNLLKLSILLDKADWRERSEAMLHAVGMSVARYPTSLGVWAGLLQQMYFEKNEIAIIGKKALELKNELLQQYIPNKLLMCATKENSNYPMLDNKYVNDTETFIYLCKDYACMQPVKTVDELLKMIKK